VVFYGPGRDSGPFDYFTLAVVGAEGKIRSDYRASEQVSTSERRKSCRRAGSVSYAHPARLIVR
jgi:hypothetical protein